MSTFETTLRNGSLDISFHREVDPFGREKVHYYVPTSVIIGLGLNAISLELRKTSKEQFTLKRYHHAQGSFLAAETPEERQKVHEAFDQAEADEIKLMPGDSMNMGRENGLILDNSGVADVGRMATFFISQMSDELRADTGIADLHARLNIVDGLTARITDLSATTGIDLTIG